MSDIAAIVAKMTLEEKAALVTGASAWTTTPVERLGVPEFLVSDGPNGVRRVPDVHQVAAQSLPATSFPTASCLAATWDVELLNTMGQALADEAIALDVGLLLGPGVNIKRSPLGGRNFEYFSEDPYLAGKMAASLIDGIQSKGVGTSLKHFAANNQEFERFSIDAKVDERALREIYLTAFEMAVKQSQPWSVMCAYNKLNGVYCSENYELLTQILRDEWGFQGFVVSDWGAVHDRVAALRAGLDLEMPGPKPRRTQAVVDAVSSGELSEEILDTAVSRVLKAVFQGATVPKGGSFDVRGHNALARRIAAEATVLLKNNGVLPLRGQHTIAVIGRSAEHAHFQGGGSSHVNPTMVASPYKSLAELAEGVEFTYAEGYTAGDTVNADLVDRAVSLARVADAAVLYIALPASKESEGYDRPDMDLTAQQVMLIKAVSAIQPNTVVVLNTGSPVTVDDWIDGVAAVVEAWMMGQAGGAAVADVLFGAVNPSGKLAETFPVKLADTPAHINWPGECGQVNYGEGIFVGYRYYDAKGVPVRFPFGFGLSYTSFAYTNVKASAKEFNDVDGVVVAVDVTNTGKVAGKEIVQVYVHDKASTLVRPPKELKGFAKVELEPGETKTVTIPLDFRAFAFYHPGHKQWITEDGDFDILVGASSADIRGSTVVTLRSTVDLPSILDHESTLKAWMMDPRGRKVAASLVEQMTMQLNAFFGGEAGDEGGIGMNPMDFMMDMPVASLLGFWESAQDISAEERVDEMLRAVRGME